MSRQAYSDEHRIFLQGIMAKGILNPGEVKDLYKIAIKRCGGDIPEEETLLKGIVPFIQCLNSELNSLNLSIVKILDEERYDKSSHYCLVNKMDRSGDTHQLTKRAMAEYQPHELELLKRIVQEIVESKDRELGTIAAINLSKTVQTKTMKNQEAEMIVNKFAEGHWLKKSDAVVRLSPRFIAEMEPYLKEFHGNDLVKCAAKGCGKIIIRGLACEFCPDGGTMYHKPCIAAMAQQQGNEQAAICVVCKKKVEFRTTTRQKQRKRRTEDQE